MKIKHVLPPLAPGFRPRPYELCSGPQCNEDPDFLNVALTRTESFMDGPTIPNNGYRSGPRSECGPRCYRNKRPYGPGCRYAKVALIATSSCDKADEHTRDMRVAKIGCSYYARSSILSFDIKRVECSTSSCYIPHIVASTALSRILLKWDRRWYYP